MYNKNPGKTQPLKSKTNKKTLQAPKGSAKEPPIQSQKRVFGTTRNIPIKAVSNTNVLKTKPDRLTKPLKKNPSIQVSPKPPEQTRSTPGEKKSPEENRAKVSKKKKSVGFEEQIGKGSGVVLAEGDGKGRLGRRWWARDSAYWLGQIKLAESVGKHFVSAAFFRLALESKAEYRKVKARGFKLEFWTIAPIRSLRVELKRYVARHEYLSEEAEWRDVSISYGLIQTEADANSGSSSSTLDQAQNDAKEERAITLDEAQTDVKGEQATEPPET
ncbi:hypothetical protein C3L33_22977, partial [Rhododendron williamsianum]